MTQICIILIHFNQPNLTDQALDSLAKINKQGNKVRVVVVDNASTKLYKLPKSLPTTWFEVIRSQSNLGFTGGNNLGLHYAIENYNPEYALLLNNDTVVDKNFLLELLDHANRYPTHGLISSKIYFYPGSEFHKASYKPSERSRVLWYAGGATDWQHLAFHHKGVDELDRGQFDHLVTSDFATGCSLLIRREVLEKIGTLDKSYFLYNEDLDFSLRARENGYKIGFCASSKVWHKNAGSSGGAGSSTADYYQTRNRYILVMKHGSVGVWITALRLMIRDLLSGNEFKIKAVWHFLSGQFGKQPLVDLIN